MSNTDGTCSCQHRPGSAIHTAGATAARTIGARLDANAAKALVQYCGAHGCSTSEGVRRALVVLAASTATPADQLLEALIELLGLPPDTATISDIHAEIDRVLAPPPAPGDGMSDNAEVAPPPPKVKAAPPKAAPKPAANPLGLSKAEQDFCAKHNLSAAQFAERKAKAVRRPTNAPAVVTASAAPKSVECPAPFSAAEIAYGDRNNIPRAELRAHLAAKKATATRRAT